MSEQPASNTSPGSIAEEARKLAEAVQDWLGSRTGRGPADVWAAATAPESFESPECRVCPLCRAMQAVSSRPDLLADLSEAAANFAAVVRDMTGPPARRHEPSDEA